MPRTMDPGKFLAALDRLTMWQGPDRDRRAPHKPLLLLWALGRARWGSDDRLASYGRVIERPLRELLQRFGPPRQQVHPEDPFWRLRKDGLWEIPEQDSVPVDRQGHPRLDPLRKTHGGLPRALHDGLRDDPSLVRRAAQKLLDENFPPSWHDDIRDAVGLGRPAVSVARDSAGRAPEFRPAVLKEYERRCAVCDFNARIEDSLLGIEAAHIKWHAAGGPDEVPNGLALCSLHHKALDKGALGLEPRRGDVIVLVSDEVTGAGPAVEQQLLTFVDRPLRLPQHRALAPAPDYLAWHRQQVFRGTPRERRA